jgi:Flp pilus assembly pilin Flp
MNRALLMLKLKICELVSEDEGQDLVEYALLCTLIILALTASISGIATEVSTVFSTVSSDL